MDGDDADGMESFEIDDRDLEFALNPGSYRSLSKNQHLYGIWADREESDDENGYAGLGSLGSRKRSKNYSAPVSFVSGGIKHGNKIEGESNDVNEEEPIRFEKRIRQQRRAAGANVLAGMRTSSSHGTIDPEKFADWAKHSKSGVIMKMMTNMGYIPGQGLGAKKQGIVEPIQAVVRPGRAAVGAYGKEAKGPNFGESAGNSQKRMDEGHPDDSLSSNAEKRGNWKKNNSKKVLTIRYKTIDEVLAEGGNLKNLQKRADLSGSGVKVIDMTGKEQKIYSGYDAYAAKARIVAEEHDEKLAFDVPELTYNINMLLDMTEETIRRTDHQLRFLYDQTTALENDRDQLKELLINERNEGRRMNEVLALLQRFTCTDSDPPTLAACYNLFEKLQTEYFEEYRLFNLEEIAIATVLPLIQKHFSTWNPLDESQTNYGYDLIITWKRILEKEDQGVLTRVKNLENLTPFERLLWDGWMPNIRRSVLKWNPRDSIYPMLKVIEKWLPLLPLWLRENLLEQIIIPRIASQVDEWNPLIDRVPIHTWLHPWLNIMGDRLHSIFAPIRQKLARALVEWHPTDQSALSILRPWKGCFASATMSAFLAQNIVPKLDKALREMIYDPTKNQRYDEFYATLSWSEMLGTEGVAAILVRSFFPKWYETLCTWLNSPRVLMDQVAMWYNEWKTRLPMEISSLPVIREQLTRALMAMNQAQQGVNVPMQPLPPPEPPSFVINRPHSPRIPPPPPQLSFKELVEMRARSAGITYVPQPNKFKEGKPVYWFGNISIYIDRNVIFGFNVETQQWAPIGLDHLINIC